jgi:hypothetical protein
MSEREVKRQVYWNLLIQLVCDNRARSKTLSQETNETKEQR